jgi:hypothetical protein
LYSSPSTNIIKSDEVEEDELVRARSMNGGEEECIEDIGGKARRKETARNTKT